MLKGEAKKRYQRDYMKSKRSNKGLTANGSNKEGLTWETIPLKDIKELLPKDIVADILALGEYDRIKERSITLEGRFRLAYKYQVWHDENFIDGIHRGSKYRANV